MSRRRFKPEQTARKGAAVVEFALIMPLLCTVTLGMLEIGRGQMVGRILDNAAQNGAQVASLSTSSNSTVTTQINSVLTAGNLTPGNATITILVNGASADVSTASANDKITITVSIPASSTSLTNFSMSLLKNSTFSSTMVVMRQG
jgi:Flp pilus assembly protein TadG